MSSSKTLYLFLIILLFGCTKKKLEFDVIQDLCEKLKIEAPDYTTTIDPCDSVTIIASFDISFTYDGSEECLYRIVNSPIFYTKKNEEISDVTFEERLEKPNFIVSGNEISYTFDVAFANAEDALNFNHLILDFNTENEIGNASNILQIRLNTTCSQVDPSTYKVNTNTVNISTSQSTFPIVLWDNAAEDGDIVSVYLNGEWIIENHTLLNDSTTFSFSTGKLISGPNDLVVYALNEGTSGPNTMSIAVNGKEIENFKPGLLTGEAVRIDF